MTYTPPTAKTWHNDPDSGVAPTGTDTALDAAGLVDLETRMIQGMVNLASYFNGVLVNVKAFGATGNGTSDDLAAINSAIASLGSAGGEVFFPSGVYAVSDTIIVPGGVTLRGTAMDYSQLSAAPARGSVIQARAGFAHSAQAVVQLSDDATSTSSGKTGASLHSMIVDAVALAASAIKTAGRRNYIHWCQAWRGTVATVDMQGQNGYLLDSVIGFIPNASSVGTGSSVKIGNTDNKVYRCQVREGGFAQVSLNAANSVEISHCHIFGGMLGTPPKHDIAILNVPTGFGEIRITDNTLESTVGHHVLWTVAASTTVGRLIVQGNTFYQLAGQPDNTYDVVALDVSAASAIMRGVVVECNTVLSLGGNYRSLINKIGAGTLEQVALIGNVCSAVRADGLMRNFRADTALGNSTRYFDGSTTAIYRTENGGVSTQSGDGSTTAFTIAHGLAGTPNHVVVTPGHTASKGDFYVTVGATNITVTYGTAPANAASNVILNWKAWM